MLLVQINGVMLYDLVCSYYYCYCYQCVTHCLCFAFLNLNWSQLMLVLTVRFFSVWETTQTYSVNVHECFPMWVGIFIWIQR